MLNKTRNDLKYQAKRGYKLNQIFENEIMWMTTKRAAAYLDISPNALRIRISRGKVFPDGYLDDRYPRFKRESLDKLLNSSFTGGKR